MTLSEFVDVTKHRIPTAPEFVALARAQKWTFQLNGDRAALLVKDRNDPFARAFAKMLGREPYRTRVLEYLQAAEPEIVARPQVAREPESAAADQEEERCETCQATVFVRSPEVQRMCCMKQCPYRRRAG